MRKMWSQGRSVSEIAKALAKSPSAVKNQRSTLKLPLRRTTDGKRKVKIGIPTWDYTILSRKAANAGQTVPGRIKALIQEDLGKP